MPTLLRAFNHFVLIAFERSISEYGLFHTNIDKAFGGAFGSGGTYMKRGQLEVMDALHGVNIFLGI